MKQLYSNSNGFTLLEMLVVMAILGAIMGAMAMTINSMLLNHDIGSDRNIVIRQIEQSGYFLSRDIQMASSVNTTVSGKFVQISSHLVDGTPQTIYYILDSGTGELTRYVDDVVNFRVAQYIDTVGTSIMPKVSENSTYKFTIKSIYKGITENATFNAQQRAPQ